ncbi:MAG TPA: stage 0 sporulation family protein [Bacillota bacterium]|jgi:cell fate regulator YaaT (PSP1 superfamily)|nr:stage 0 sporulation family protein [Bacillota bacterium]HOL13581.1 stage 0 sporulation family protein [Bacillota bacterium]HPQ11005.1 stage 0 sporulation family protein [Bacillota bacterium]HPT60706.1 stage 0 sporulation family protein [Bacillota bacterium]HPZ73707.1 stage 0 sporulation family protein [Bacillota bacterium]
MVKVVGVRFREAGKVYYFSPGDLEISENESVIVETVRGVEYGDVVIGIKEVDESETVQPLKEVLRKATEEDKIILQENRNKEKEAFQVCLEKIEKHGLPMKLIDVEYTFDRKKVIFYYTAPGRVDFRELVKDLASVFRTRIELRQIGVRDEAKMIGGLGPCGRSLCCATFLGEFAPVSIKMAKKQNLSLNPSKISGVCGRLMCCLRYEYEVYEQGELGGNAPVYHMLDIDDDDEELILDDEELDNPKPKGRNFKAKGGCDHKSCPNGKNCFK